MNRRVLGTLCALALVLLSLTALPAHATVPEPTTSPATGNSTYFDGLGSPYGGCGLPQAELESQDFVALNVYDTPGDYNFYPRPVTDTSKIGMWNNGHNCGRWVHVQISDLCTGVNDGAPGQPFCRNGSFVADEFNGATLDMLVADSCGDSNAWCRDDPYHLDLAKASLGRFVLDGQTVNLLPDHFNNRHLQWSFIPAPNYSGDIKIGFLQGAQQWWPAISVSHLPNGLHGVEYFANGAWQQAQMNGDMGQSYIIGGTTTGGTQFQIRVRDVNDQLINNGATYSFSLPATCSPQCSPAYTEITYTTGDGGPGSSPPGSPSASGSPSAAQSSSPPTTGSPRPAGACSATYTVTSSWSGGYQADVTVHNNGTSTVNAWSVSFIFAGSQQVSQAWNAQVSQSGQQVTAGNVGYNGTLAGGASTNFGMIVSGDSQPVPTPSCIA